MDVKKWNVVKYELDNYEKKHKQALLIEQQIVTSISTINNLIISISKAASDHLLLLEEQLEEAILNTRDLLAKFEVLDLTVDETKFKNFGHDFIKEHVDFLNKKIEEYRKYSTWQKERLRFLNEEFIKSKSSVKKQALYEGSSNNSSEPWERALDSVLEQNKQILEYINKANLVLEEMYSCPFHSIMKLKNKRIEYLRAAEHILNQLKMMEFNHYA